MWRALSVALASVLLLELLGCASRSQQPLITEKYPCEIVEFAVTEEAITESFELAAKRSQMEPEKTIIKCDEALKEDPNNWETYHARAKAWFHLEEWDKSIIDLSRAAELNPHSCIPYNNCGNVWARKGEYDRALQDYNRAIELDPEFEKAYFARGVMWYKKCDYFKAMVDFSRAIELNPKYTNAYHGRIQVLSATDQCDDQLAEMERLIELDKLGKLDQKIRASLTEPEIGFDEIVWIK